MRSRSPSSSAPGLWRMESGTPTLPMSCMGAASSSVSQSAGGMPIVLARWAQTRLMRGMGRGGVGAGAAHARGGAARLGVARLGDLAEPVHDLELGVAQVLRALAHAALEHPVVADDALLLLDQQPRQDAEHPADRLRVLGEHAVEVLRADLDGLAVLDGDDGRRARRAVQHGELAEHVTGAEPREHVALDALHAAHLKRARAHEVDGVAERSLLEHRFPGGVASRPCALGQRLQRCRRQAAEHLALPQVGLVNCHSGQCRLSAHWWFHLSAVFCPLPAFLSRMENVSWDVPGSTRSDWISSGTPPPSPGGPEIGRWARERASDSSFLRSTASSKACFCCSSMRRPYPLASPRMDATTLRAIQAPLKARYRDDPDAALVPLWASGSLGEGITCSVETGRALAEAGLHPASGGDGSLLCSRDILLEALAARAAG